MIMQHQEKKRWCWAAVAASIHNLLNGGTRDWTQGEVATPVLRGERQIRRGVDCRRNPELCNFVAALDDALKITGNLRSDGFRQNKHLKFDNIKEWVNAQLPVGARIVWWSGGAHFVAIDGFREFDSGVKQVHVQDPIYGPSFQNYEAFVSGYGPGGDWQDTYLVKGSTNPPLDPNGDD